MYLKNWVVDDKAVTVDDYKEHLYHCFQLGEAYKDSILSLAFRDTGVHDLVHSSKANVCNEYIAKDLRSKVKVRNGETRINNYLSFTITYNPESESDYNDDVLDVALSEMKTFIDMFFRYIFSILDKKKVATAVLPICVFHYNEKFSKPHIHISYLKQGDADLREDISNYLAVLVTRESEGEEFSNG